MTILSMRAFFLICLFSLLGIQARPLLEHGYSSIVKSNYGTPAMKNVDKVLLRMVGTHKPTPGLQRLVQPSLATSYGRTLSPPPPPKPAPPTHYHEASDGVYESPPNPFLASS